MGIKLFVSLTCFRESYEEKGLAWIFENVAKLGLDGVELWNVRGEMNKIKEMNMLKDFEIVSPSYCCVGTNFASANKSDRMKAQEVIKKELETCVRIKATIMRIDLGPAPSDVSYLQVKKGMIGALERSAADAGREDITLAIHNHGRNWTGESLVIKDIIETVGSPYLRARLCPGNFFLVPTEPSPIEAAQRLLSLSAGIFLKDFTETQDKSLPFYFEVKNKRYIGASIGHGVIDYTGVFKLLKDVNYAGYLILNIERGMEEDLTAIRESVSFVKNQLKGLWIPE